MIKKIFLVAISFLTIFSCSRYTIVEDIIEQYEEGGSKVVHYYQEKKNGERVWIKETWFYKEGMKHLEGPIVDGKRNGDFKSYYKSGNVLSEGNFVDGKREGKATTKTARSTTKVFTRTAENVEYGNSTMKKAPCITKLTEIYNEAFRIF